MAPADDSTLGLAIDTAQPGGSPQVNSWSQPVPVGPDDRYDEMIDNLRSFLDHVAAARPTDETVNALSDDLAAWRDRLAPDAVSEREQVFGHRLDLAGRGQTMSPRFVAEASGNDEVRGTVRFGRYYLGANGAVHGGAVPLLFDDVLGGLSNSGGRAPARAAYLKTDYRSVTPVGAELRVHAWFEREEGRKRLLRGTIHHGDTLCADAEALFVAVRPGQQ